MSSIPSYPFNFLACVLRIFLYWISHILVITDHIKPLPSSNHNCILSERLLFIIHLTSSPRLPPYAAAKALWVPQHFLLPTPSSYLQTVFPLSSGSSRRAAGCGAARGEGSVILDNPPQAGVRLAPMWRVPNSCCGAAVAVEQQLPAARACTPHKRTHTRTANARVRVHTQYSRSDANASLVLCTGGGTAGELEQRIPFRPKIATACQIFVKYWSNTSQIDG